MNLMRCARVEQVPEGAQGNEFITRYLSILIYIEGAGELLDLCRISSSPRTAFGKGTHLRSLYMSSEWERT